MELREAVELAKRWRETWMVEDDRRFKSSAPEITEALTLLIDAAEKSSPPPDAAIVERCAATDALRPRPLDDWHDDIGDVLWWRFPITEPPYVGTPLDDDWPFYHTHWTPIPVPNALATPPAERGEEKTEEQ